MSFSSTLLIGTRDQGQATGISQMFELLIQGFDNARLPYYVVDLTLGTPTKKASSFNLKRATRLLGAIFKAWLVLPKVKTVYLTVGVSILGFFRDAAILWPSFILHRSTVIHVHSGGYGDFFHSQNKFFRFVIKNTLRRVDRIIVLGELLKEQFNFLPLTEEKIHVVLNGLSLGLSPDSVDSKKTVQGKLRLLFLSNMIVSKGYLDLLEACSILYNERNIPVECNFCGGFRSTVQEKGSGQVDEDTFYSLVKQMHLENIAKYQGIVVGKEKENYLKNSDVLVLPTYYPSEGQPTCIIEAMAFGMPVIATNFRGIPEEVINGYNGFLVPIKSPVRIADAIESIWRDHNLYSSMSRNAINHYRRNFTQESHIAQIIPVITNF